MLILNALQTSQTSSPIVLKTVQQGHLTISILWDKQSQQVSGQVSDATSTRDVSLKGLPTKLSEKHLENAIASIATCNLSWNGTTIECNIGLQGGGSSSSKPQKASSTPAAPKPDLERWTESTYKKVKQEALTSGNEKLIKAYNELDRIRDIKETITASGYGMEMDLFSLVVRRDQTTLITQKEKLQDELLAVFDTFIEVYGGDDSPISENHASAIHCLNTMGENQYSMLALPGQKEAARRSYELSQSMFAKLNKGQKDPAIAKKIRGIDDPTALF